MIISLIVALGKNYQIGKDNQLLWHVKEDLMNFKKLTTGHHVVFGLNTYRSIGKKLPNRFPIVLSPTPIEDVITTTSVNDTISIAKKNNESELFICGGAQIYNLFFPVVTKLYLSWMNYDGPADTYFKIDTSSFSKIHFQNFSNWTYEIWEKVSS